MRKKVKLVHGVGINNAEYNVTVHGLGDQSSKIISVCPFYRKWKDMLGRCYNSKFHEDNPTYVGCYTVPEWHYFMTFRAWMETQDWEGKVLDKDILFPGNRVYGPDTCIFVDKKVNTFTLDSKATKGRWPTGVSFETKEGRFKAACNSVVEKRQVFLGYFDDPDEAHKVWLSFKLEQAKILASSQNDPRVAKALINFYENYERREKP